MPQRAISISLETLLRSDSGDSRSALPPTVQQAIHVARVLQGRANELQTPQERRQQAELDRMIRSPKDKATLTQMTDQAFRPHASSRTVDQLIHILDVQGVPRFFSMLEQTLLRGFQSFGSYLPGVAVPLIKEKMQHETANVILPAESEILSAHLEARRREAIRMNVNLLGEAILSEPEAERRLEAYLQALQMPEIEVVSIKISTIDSQISPLARKGTVQRVSDRLERLYRTAAELRFTRTDGTAVPKFVYLDMEEYRDMALTAEAFMRTLDRPGLESIQAGIALQAYLPDAYRVQREIAAWARHRVARGRAPITVRIVKGANLEMERVEAAIRGWPQAPYLTKRETDANYKRMIDEGLRSENSQAIRLGIASHNLFELAYGLVLAWERNSLSGVQFEMLEGMANHQRRAWFELTRNLLLYAPACRQDQFLNAIGYLIRRLDENTGPDNFLSHAFRLKVDSPDWRRLEQQFVDSFASIPTLSDAPRRSQDRRQPPPRPAAAAHTFVNEPDTDFALPHHTEWAEAILADWRPRWGESAEEVPLVIDGRERRSPQNRHESFDPSRPGTVVARNQQATKDDLVQALASARADEDGWRSRSPAERAAVLRQAAQEIRAARRELMGAALAEAGKLFTESDPEVSEAVDFAEFYTRSAETWHGLTGVTGRGKGVVVVVSPWNFPLAIPCGGVAAALAAGNTVLLKPASDTVMVAYRLCQCFWRAGVSQKTLQFVPCSGAEGGEFLVSHPHVDAVILTGGTETARRMLAKEPRIHLLAETGGKNATIVTAMSDREQAIKHVLHSAFSHSGQKCSATSLLILEDEVYDDPNFRRTLAEAVTSLKVGSAWELDTRIGPLIRPPAGALQRNLTDLDEGESWLVPPQRSSTNPQLVSPAVKWGVRPGSPTHLTELFGPVLGVMRARNLEEAICIVNSTGYGLTSGLESLDDREQARWCEGIRAGNLYINRSTTGAIVLRQPFGGLGKSSFGPAIKAGGPNYVAQFMRFSESKARSNAPEMPDSPVADLRDAVAAEVDFWSPDERSRILAALASYEHDLTAEFSGDRDDFLLLGQDNLRRYLPVQQLRIRVHPEDSPFEIIARAAAARLAGCRTTVSSPRDSVPAAVEWLEQATRAWAGGIEFIEEDDDELSIAIRQGRVDRVRYASRDRVPDMIRRASAETGVYLAAEPVLPIGRLELLWYFQEQSISFDYHRYGNLGIRAGEERSGPS